ncbi:hypothetical protein RIF29_18788 [Crotalaria pallida]|uniref:Uncharacterized protein n=1 Tax=Crotalaria pallida TaxID=3830 RepID=A0AAN9F6K7_CROPI
MEVSWQNFFFDMKKGFIGLSSIGLGLVRELRCFLSRRLLSLPIERRRHRHNHNHNHNHSNFSISLSTFIFQFHFFSTLITKLSLFVCF